MRTNRKLALLAVVTAGALRGAIASIPASTDSAKVYGALPLAFEANHGQTDRAVDFLARGPGYSVFLKGGGVVLALQGPGPKANREGMRGAGTKRDVVRLELVGARSRRGSGEHGLPGQVNYFVGNGRRQWRTGIPTYARVAYEDVYPGVDLVYYGNQAGRLEHDFVVKPGTDPAIIGLSISGAEDIEIDAQGDLVLRTESGPLRFEKPRIYQDLADGRHEVAGAYERRSRHRFGFSVSDYDASRPLVIDPVLIYSTYLGGTGHDAPFAIAADDSGAAYVYGFAYSADFPATGGAFDTTHGGCDVDAFVTKLDPAGAALVYSTYLGGSNGRGEGCSSYGTGIAVDDSGSAYVTGFTGSADFPTTPGAYDTSINGLGNAFVTKLDPAGASLAYSTFLGGSFIDLGTAIAVDAAGAAYVAGETLSMDFPTTPGAFDTTFSGFVNGFVTKIAPGGAALAYSTHLGDDVHITELRAIAVDAAGAAYVAGTTSTGSPGYGGFAAKLHPTGTTLLYSRQLGSVYCDDYFNSCLGLAVDSSGSAYVAGATASPAFPTTPGAYDTTHNGGPKDGFVLRLDQAGAALVYSTFLGGSSEDRAVAIAVDTSGAAWVAGWTRSVDFPVTAEAIDPTYNGGVILGDGFAAKLDPTGTTLAYSSYLGGSGEDNATGIAVDASGLAYVTGGTFSTDFPTTAGAFDASFNGSSEFGTDAYVVRFCVDCNLEPPCLECAADAPGERVPICHAPPGNVENHRTLRIPPSALPDHCGHGDTCGSCEEDAGPEIIRERGVRVP